MECSFRHVVFTLGLQFMGLGQTARVTLTNWETQFGIKPSFTLGSPFGTKRVERTESGELIIREASSEFFSEETYEQRFSRILARHAFSNLKSVLEGLGFTQGELLKLVLKHDGIADIIGESIYSLQVEAKLPDERNVPGEWRARIGLFDADTEFASRVEITDVYVRIEPAGVDLLNKLLRKFREQLTRGSSLLDHFSGR
jgi:hypothetical protein